MAKVNPSKTPTISVDALLQAFRTMSTARAMSDLFEANARLTSKYVHACSRGHEAIQFAAGRLLQEQDFLSAYYRDDCLLLSIGLKPEELMLQLLRSEMTPSAEAARTIATLRSTARDFLEFRIKVVPRACRPYQRLESLWAFNTASAWASNTIVQERRQWYFVPSAMPL